MLSRAVSSAAAAARPARATRASATHIATFATDASDDKKPRAKGKNLRFGETTKNDREPRKFSFALKDKQGHKGKDASSTSADRADHRADRGQGNGQKKFSFAPSAKAKEQAPPLEVFDAPAYWSEDFPAEFDDSMKHEVEKLEVFADFTMLIDSSWQKEIHPLFDGSAIELTLNAPLEDFDERLFIDDKNTFDTKVVMEVPLTCFSGLTPEGRELVKQLAGPRYQANKKQLKLTEDRYATRVHNHKRLCDILRDLTQTASELAAAQTAEAKQ